MRYVVALAAIQDGCILVVKKQETWILPGGKPEPNETQKDCLLRELSEELPNCTVTNLSMLGTWTGQTPHTGDMIQCWAYLGKVEGDIQPGAEISEAKWLPGDAVESYNLSDVTRQIIMALRFAGRL